MSTASRTWTFSHPPHPHIGCYLPCTLCLISIFIFKKLKISGSLLIFWWWWFLSGLFSLYFVLKEQNSTFSYSLFSIHIFYNKGSLGKYPNKRYYYSLSSCFFDLIFPCWYFLLFVTKSLGLRLVGTGLPLEDSGWAVEWRVECTKTKFTLVYGGKSVNAYKLINVILCHMTMEINHSQATQLKEASTLNLLQRGSLLPNSRGEERYMSFPDNS